VSITIDAHCDGCDGGIDPEGEVYCQTCWQDTVNYANATLDEFAGVLEALKRARADAALLKRLDVLHQRLRWEFRGEADERRRA
jgi:hypothetical protein